MIIFAYVSVCACVFTLFPLAAGLLSENGLVISTACLVLFNEIIRRRVSVSRI